MLAVLAQEGTPTPAPGPSCSGSGFCEFVYDQTKSTWLAESSYWVLVKPLTILLIVLVALIVRFLVHRTIDRLIRHTVADHEAAGTEATGTEATGTEAGGTGFSLFRPLRNRMSTALVMPSERREQRARALGSVLRSIASATIFTVALMLILGELGVNLGPLLASAGVAGLAIGFGAQNLVKDFISGLFMLFEDQYGVGDFVDVGEVTGTVEAVGLRITTLRDGQGRSSGTCATARSSASATRARAGPWSSSTYRSDSCPWTRRPRSSAMRRPR